jgi:hypothetical protein
LGLHYENENLNEENHIAYRELIKELDLGKAKDCEDEESMAAFFLNYFESRVIKESETSEKTFYKILVLLSICNKGLTA